MKRKLLITGITLAIIMLWTLAICLACNRVLDVGPVHLRLPGPEVVMCGWSDPVCNGNPFNYPIPPGR